MSGDGINGTFVGSPIKPRCFYLLLRLERLCRPYFL